MSANGTHHLILTVDYELFGNGSGCLAKCVIAPTERILSIADRFAAPVTLFVEALEFLAMESEQATSAHVEVVRAQIQAATKNGHDAQLHLHPQWANASYNNDARWVLDIQKWRIGDLGAEDIRRLLTSGKEWLETALRPVQSDYICYAFRAGGWCVQPSALVLEALAALNFRLDSTVAPGLGNAARGDWYDFRAAPCKPCWRVVEDVCAESEAGIWEVPITVARFSRTGHAMAILRKKWRKAFELAPGCVGSYAGPNSTWYSLAGKASKLASLGCFMLDISTMPAVMLISAVKHWQSKFAHVQEPMPIVAIGHSKNFTSVAEAELEKFLQWVTTQENLVFSRYDTWLKAIDRF